MTRARLVSRLATFGLLLLPSVATGQVVRSGAGTTNVDAALLAARDAFRVDVGGGTTAAANGSFGGVRREINWDGVPASQASPNNLNANFFNTTSPRGVLFSTPGTGFRVSSATSDPSAAPVNFGDINAAYSATFQAFSPQRLFTAIGSNMLDVNFYVAGTTTAALTNGFGAIFSDVDLQGSTSLQFFDVNNLSLGTFNAGIGVFSFLGVSFGTPSISRVRITSGNGALGAGINDGGQTDLVVMDDFIYGEPSPTSTVPEPSSFVLTAFAGAMLWIRVRRRNKPF